MPRQSRKNKTKQQSAQFGLQAILLADSYASPRFRPLTLDTAKVLLPIGGIPMINYSLELLIDSGIIEIFIITTNHSQKIEQYIQKSKWFKRELYPNVKIQI